MFGLRLGLGDADAVVDLVEHPVLNDGADFEVLEEHAGLTAVAVRSVGWGGREWGELNVMERVAPVNLTDRTIRMWPVGLLIAGGTGFPDGFRPTPPEEEFQPNFRVARRSARAAPGNLPRTDIRPGVIRPCRPDPFHPGRLGQARPHVPR